MKNNRRIIITKEWLADYYANGVQGKYKASVKNAVKQKPKNKGGVNDRLPKTKSL